MKFKIKIPDIFVEKHDSNSLKKYDKCPHCGEERDIMENIKYKRPNVFDGIQRTVRSRTSIFGNTYHKTYYSCWHCGCDWETKWYRKDTIDYIE